MNVKKGVDYVLMPAFSHIQQVTWGDPRNGPMVALQHIPMVEIIKYRKSKPRGIPVYFAMGVGRNDKINELHFWPAPAEDGCLTIIYAPPLCQI